jgi:hypothetical protein
MIASLTPYTLTVTFLGLVTFVPVETSGNLKSMYVLLVNAEDGAPPCSEEEHGDEIIHERHYAALRYPARNVVGGLATTTGVDPMVVTYIRGYEVHLETGTDKPSTADAACNADGSALRRLFRAKSPSTTDVPDPKVGCDRRSFGWLADIQKLDKEMGKVCEDCLRPIDDPDFPWDRVASRLTLTQGTLSTTALSRDMDGKYQVYQYPETGTLTLEQVLTEAVTLRLGGLTQPVVFVLEDEKGSTRRIALAPAMPGDEVHVDVLNKPAWAIIGADEPEEVDDENHDFTFYYRLSEKLDAWVCDEHNPLPIPIEKTGSFNRPICPNALMH